MELSVYLYSLLRKIILKHDKRTETMAYTGRFEQDEDYRREELIRKIEHAVANLTLQELEALYYDMSTKNYIND